MATVPKLTKAKIREITAPKRRPKKGGVKEYREDGTGRGSVENLAIRVYRKSATWVYRSNEVYYTLGKVALMSREEAIEELKFQREREGREAAGEGKTLRDVWEDLLRWKDQVNAWKPETVRQYKGVWSNHLHPFHDTPVGEIEGMVRDVRDWHRELAEELPATANRAKSLLHLVIEHARTLIWYKGINPCTEDRVPRAREERKSTPMRPEHYQRVGEAIRRAKREGSHLPLRSILAVETILLTGCRRSEPVKARLEHCKLDGEAPFLALPPEGQKSGYKTGEWRKIYLPKRLARELKSLNRPKGCQWVFPGDKAGDHYKNPHPAWKSLFRDAGYSEEDMPTPHSARHGFRTLMGRARDSKEHEVMQDLMGHARGSSVTDEVYLHETDEDVHSAVSTYHQQIQSMMGDEGEEVPVN